MALSGVASLVSGGRMFVLLLLSISQISAVEGRPPLLYINMPSNYSQDSILFSVSGTFHRSRSNMLSIHQDNRLVHCSCLNSIGVSGAGTASDDGVSSTFQLQFSAYLSGLSSEFRFTLIERRHYTSRIVYSQRCCTHWASALSVLTSCYQNDLLHCRDSTAEQLHWPFIQLPVIKLFKNVDRDECFPGINDISYIEAMKVCM